MNLHENPLVRPCFFLFAAALALAPACDAPAGGLDLTDDESLPYGMNIERPLADADEAPTRDEALAVDDLAQATRPSAAKFPCRILALGDSITWGLNGDWEQQQDPSGNFLGGYRSHLVYGFGTTPSVTVGPILMVGVRQDNSPPWLVSWGQSWHAGAPGFTNAQLATAVNNGASSVNPDIILLHAGTNDILSGPAPKVTNAVNSLNTLLANLKQKNPSATILLAKIIPLAGPLNAEVTQYNAKLDAVAANRRAIGQKVWTVDLNTNFPVATLEDGIHPNWDGYANMAKRWRSALDARGCW